MRTHELLHARATALAGKNPTQRGREKTRQALMWVHRWGWSSAQTVDRLAGVKRKGLSARLVRQGLLKATKTESGGAIAGVPRAILTLTTAGVEMAEAAYEHAVPYCTDPYRINQATLRHDGLAQRATLDGLLAGAISDYRTERELAEGDMPGRKRFDIIWLNGNVKIGVEVELSRKYQRALDVFVTGIVGALASGRVDIVTIITDNKPLQKAYMQALKPGSRYGLYDRKNLRWTQVDTARVPDSAKDSIVWKILD